MDPKKCRPWLRRFERSAVVDILVQGEGPALERTLASLRLARCQTSVRIVAIPSHLSPLGRLHPDHDVVLLRAGTEVFKGWLDRLSKAMHAEPMVGSVIPFSSAGCLSGYPVPHGADPEAQVAFNWAQLDQLAKTTNAGRTLDVPFPDGCCIYVRREYLSDVMEKGATAYLAGWRHLLAADVVAHLVNPPGEPISAWPADLSPHPLRDAALASYLRADVARFYRRRLDLARLTGEGPAMLLVTHVGGGGTERHIRDMAHALEDEGVRTIILRPQFGGSRLLLQRLMAGATPSLVFDLEAEYTEFLEALVALMVRHVHVHHTLGFPVKLRRLIEELSVPYDFTVHDYHLICPRIHLGDRSGRYCGEPAAPEDCNECLAKNGDYHNVRTAAEIETWRAAGYPWLAGARRVFVPHADVGARLARYYPDVEYHERRHFETLAHARFVAASLEPGQPLRVALLGTLAPHKGSAVLLECAREAQRRDRPIEFVVLGTAENAADLRANGVTLTGEYAEDAVFDLLEAMACHCALFLSIWPEAYCYTLSIALAGGLYCLAFDLGAQGARLRELAWGEVLPLDSSAEEINDRLQALGERLHQMRPAPQPSFAQYPRILQDYYGLDAELKPVGEAEPGPLSAAGRSIIPLDQGRRLRGRRPVFQTDRIILPLVGRGITA